MSSKNGAIYYRSHRLYNLSVQFSFAKLSVILLGRTCAERFDIQRALMQFLLALEGIVISAAQTGVVASARDKQIP